MLEYQCTIYKFFVLCKYLQYLKVIYLNLISMNAITQIQYLCSRLAQLFHKIRIEFKFFYYFILHNIKELGRVIGR